MQRSPSDIHLLRTMILLEQAVSALDEGEFSKYIHLLDLLGTHLENEYLRFFSDNRLANTKNLKITWLKFYLQKLPRKPLIENLVAYCVFEEAWRDEYLQRARAWSVKGKLNRSIRRRINLALHAVALVAKIEKTPALSKEELIEYEREASVAIQSYRTAWQQVLAYVGKVLALLMASVCGVSTAVTVIAASMTNWSLVSTAAFAGLAGAATILTNWLTYKNAVPAVLIDVFGRDVLFRGWLQYYDKETGEKKHFSAAQSYIWALSFLFAISVGLSNGALLYNFLVSMQEISLFPFLAPNTLLGSFLPGVAGGFTLIFCICVTSLMLNAFVDLLREKSMTHYLMTPLRRIQDIFNEAPHANSASLKFKKMLTYTALVLVTSIALFGLVSMQIQGSVSLREFLFKTSGLSLEVATRAALVISMIFSLIGQLPFITASSFKAITQFAAKITHQASINNEPELTSDKVLKGGLTLLSAAGNGSIVLNTFNRRSLCWLGFAGNSWNVISGVIASESGDNQQKIVRAAKSSRIEKIGKINHYLSIATNPGVTPSLKETFANLYIPNRKRCYHQFFFTNAVTPLEEKIVCKKSLFL